jgi:PAS domain S-box-containing protein
MIMTLPLAPIWVVDVVGSALMIIFSFLCVRLARRLLSQDRNNIIWTYLLWLCYSLAAFAISRSAGHITSRLLLAGGYKTLWESIQPYSGAVNSLMFVVVASITLFFERIWKVYQQILKDKHALQETHEKLVFMNRNLEELVVERTRELASSERKYRRIFEVSPDLIAVVSGDGAVRALNPAGTVMLGLGGQGEISGKTRFTAFFQNPDDWGNLETILHKEGQIIGMEVLLRRADGSSFSALISGTAERHPDGSINAIHLLAKDISQRKTMEKQLLQADKLASIGQLAAGIAHEINNPLSMILGYTQLLLRSEDQASQKHADLKIVEKHARTCKTIVGDLLSFARSTRTKREMADLHRAIEEILSVVRHHFELDGVEIERRFDMEIPSLVIDEEKVKQVFMNLIMNAKQAIGKNGTISLCTQYDHINGLVSIRVADTGSGISQEYLSRVFDPFFTTKSTGEGTGLGLSVSYGIVKDHGGDILVESEPGKGSTFTVVLPVSTGNGAAK